MLPHQIRAEMSARAEKAALEYLLQLGTAKMSVSDCVQNHNAQNRMAVHQAVSRLQGA